MKKLTALLTLISFIGGNVTPALAFIGGPYGNNTYDGFQGGVFQGTMTMSGGYGIFRFGTGFEPAITPQAQSVIMLNGLVLYGECFGYVDFPSRTVGGVTNSLAKPAGDTTGLGTPNALRNGTNDYVVNTNFQGKITSTRPTVLFKGKGVLTFFSETYDDNSATSVDTVEATVDIPAADPLATAPGTRASATTQTISNRGLAEMETKKLRFSGSRLTPIAYSNLAQAAPSADARN